MTYSKDPIFLRSIIMQHYELPSQKIDNINSVNDLISYQNKSTTCIDDITVYMEIKNSIINKVYFSGLGCAISTASTDIMANYLIGKSVDEANKIINNYINMTLGNKYDEELLNELIAFYQIKNQSNRIKCSQIGIYAIKNCIDKIINNEKL